MIFNIVASGSKGNATLIKENNTLIIIDLGISHKRLEEGLKEINLSFSDIDACFITHEHHDHISGIKAISPKKIYCLKEVCFSSLNNKIELYEEVQVKDLTVTAFKTSHDARNPCGFLVKSKNDALVYMTDTGQFINDNIKFLKNPDYLIIECNHDIQMLLKTNRPACLIDRILSQVGHLCNEDSAYACLSIMGDKTKQIILAHISEEANTPKIALNSYKKILKEGGIDIDLISIKCANQHHSLLGGKNEN